MKAYIYGYFIQSGDGSQFWPSLNSATFTTNEAEVHEAHMAWIEDNIIDVKRPADGEDCTQEWWELRDGDILVTGCYDRCIFWYKEL